MASKTRSFRVCPVDAREIPLTNICFYKYDTESMAPVLLLLE